MRRHTTLTLVGVFGLGLWGCGEGLDDGSTDAGLQPGPWYGAPPQGATPGVTTSTTPGTPPMPPSHAGGTHGQPPPAGGSSGGGTDQPPRPDNPDNDPDAGATAPEPEPVACNTLNDALTVTPVAGTQWSVRVSAAARQNGGAVIAWSGGGGVHLTPVDALGARDGDDVVVEGNLPYGIAVADDRWGVLVDRGFDTLAFVAVDPNGQVAFDQALVGAGSGDGAAFGEFIRDGRITWTGERWATYFAITEGGHYGDTLRFYTRDGQRVDGGWAWGCSHSMELRIASNAGNVGPVCISDCYPTQGVHFDHETFIYTDSAGDCSGGYSATLGGIVPMRDGYWLAFTSIDGRQARDPAIVFVNGSGQPGAINWLSAGPDVANFQIGAYHGDLLAGLFRGGRSELTVLDPDGTTIRQPEVVDADLSATSDFFTYQDGAAGCAGRSNGSIGVARLVACE